MVVPKCQARTGFTLLELLVVIFIIGMLAALLLPAVNSAGSGGRRTVCNNSLRHLALASLNFESAKNRFPGYLEQPLPEHDREFPWLVSLMPMMERNDVHDSWMDPGNEPVKLYVKLLRCPSDPPPTLSDCNSYACNAGLIVKSSNELNVFYEDDNLPANGIFIDLRRHRGDVTFVKTKDIYDGKSFTLLVCENLLAGGWGDVSPVAVSGEQESQVKLTAAFCWFNTKTPSIDMRINGNRKTAEKLTPELLRPSSNHPRGAQVAFADGHTLFLRDDIDYRVYKELMTSNNKKSSNLDQDYVLKDADYE